MLEPGDVVEFENLSGTFEVNNPVEITIDGEPFVLVPGPAATPATVVISPTRINRCSKGVTTVALLGSAFLDVRDLGFASLDFGADGDPANAVDLSMRVRLADVNDDGFLDAVLQVKTSELYRAGLLENGEPLFVTGALADGTLVRGFDEVYLANGRNCK